MAYRQRRVRDRLVFDDSTFDTLVADTEEKDSSYDERRKALAVCVTKLNERQRKLIAERYHRGLSVEAIADELRQSANTIAQALFRARKNLLSCIRQAIQVPEGA
jgi:RNA polymerase sigma-70 factor (ECF subfamily)